MSKKGEEARRNKDREGGEREREREERMERKERRGGRRKEEGGGRREKKNRRCTSFQGRFFFPHGQRSPPDRNRNVRQIHGRLINSEKIFQAVFRYPT
jgi:hypothetical protein